MSSIPEDQGASWPVDRTEPHWPSPLAPSAPTPPTRTLDRRPRRRPPLALAATVLALAGGALVARLAVRRASWVVLAVAGALLLAGVAGATILARRRLPRPAPKALAIGGASAVAIAVFVPASLSIDRCTLVGADADLTSCDLSGQDLSGEDLQNADLTGAKLTGAVLRDADITDARLADAVLDGADLAGARLPGVVATGADLTDADLSGAVLAGADLTDATVAGTDLAEADLTGAKLAGLDLSGDDLTGADLSDVDLAEATLADARLTRAHLDDANLRAAHLGGADLERADLRRAQLVGADLAGARLVDARLGSADLSTANLAGADLTGATLRADLEGARLTEATLADATLDGSGLRDADLTRADLTGASANAADFRGATFTGARLGTNDFIDAEGITDQQLAAALGVPAERLPGATARRGIRFDQLEDIVAAVAPVANGRAVERARAYAPSAEFHPAVVLEATTTDISTPTLASTVQDEWAPTGLRYAELVVSVQPQTWESIEVCQYTYNGAPAPPITRYVSSVTVRVLAAHDGRLVEERTFRGSEPRACMPTESYGLEELRGDPPDVATQATPWLVSLIHPPDQRPTAT